MSESHPLRFLTDRTTIETDWLCGMKRWWYREYNGKGIVPAQEAIYYKQGRELHADYAALVTGADVTALVKRILTDAVATLPFPTQIQLEYSWWHAGMVASFGLFILPKWLENYRPILVEKEMVLERGPLQIACTEDLALIGREDRPTNGEVIVIDYKSVKWLSPAWVLHWPYAVQMLINAKAIEEGMGVKVKSTYVVGVQKGQVRDGKLRHPYVYAYANASGDKWSHEWKPKPMELRPLWEKGEGVDHTETLMGWVKELGLTTAIDLHPMSAPIMANDRLLNKLIRGRVRREGEVHANREAALVDETVREAIFPANFSACRPTIGDECPYLAACHNAVVNADPIGSGLYVTRVPHHDLEWLTKESE